jgi:hypothetical protein
MSIQSLFTSHEKLFNEWLMHHEFNNQIQAEPRFSGYNQDDVYESYYTIPKETPPVKGPLPAELRKIWGDRFNEKGIPISVAPNVKMDGAGQPIIQDPEAKPIYRILHGPEVQAVEKKDSPVVVKYGNFCGRTYFTVTNRLTDYFLVDGWLVVSIPENQDEKAFKIDSDTEITVVHKFDGAKDPVSSEIAKKVQNWFAWHRSKLLNVFMITFSASVMLSLSVIALGTQHHLAGKLLSRALLVSSIAMQGMFLYVGYKYYRIYLLEEKMSSIKNLGHWVKQIRQSVVYYPVSSIGAPIDKFFPPKELFGLIYLREHTDISIKGYIRRFFRSISCWPTLSTRV